MALEDGSFGDLFSLLNPQGPYDPALGSLVTNGGLDEFIPQFASAGVRPPDLTQLAMNDSSLAPHNLLRNFFGVQPTEFGAPPDLASGATPSGAITPLPPAGPIAPVAPNQPGVAPAGPEAPSLNVPVPRPRPAIPEGGGGGPLDIRPPAQKAETPTDVSAQSKASKASSDLLKALSGVKAPPNPEFQKITTPHVTAPHQINVNAGQTLLTQLLHSISGGAGAVAPIRLGQALVGR